MWVDADAMRWLMTAQRYTMLMRELERCGRPSAHWVPAREGWRRRAELRLTALHWARKGWT